MSLTLYKLRDHLDGALLVDPSLALRSLDAVDEHSPEADIPFAARLFLGRSTRRFPDWARKLMPHFADGTFWRVRGAGAVLFVEAPSFPGAWFAFAFGQRGRHLLRPDAYVRLFGLKTALNVIYSGEGSGGDRVRSVDAKTVAANTLRTRTQADRRAVFEEFGVDARRDLLSGITGAPADRDAWGTRVSGTDRLSVTKQVEFGAFGALCDMAQEAFGQTDYQQSFSWIDDLLPVADPSVTEALLDLIVGDLTSQSSELELAVPEIVEWGAIARFRFSFDQENEFADPEGVDLAEALDEVGRLAGLSVAGLKSRYRIEAINDDGEQVAAWPVLQCLSGELTFGGERFIVSEGTFFQVRDSLLADLALYVDALEGSPVQLPASPGDFKEELYNAHVVETVGGTLLMDKRTVRVPGTTSPIEVCDVLTDDGRFIHVKRKLGSSQLSHLFSQGARSLELAVISPDFRQVTLDKIVEVAAEAGKDAADFQPFTAVEIDATTLSVDYAIVAKWNGRTPSQALPFFSQLNLRSFAEGIRSLRGRVTLTRVEIQE
jgi:uncharacterized protein (TIGR04141 family)